MATWMLLVLVATILTLALMVTLVIVISLSIVIVIAMLIFLAIVAVLLRLAIAPSASDSTTIWASSTYATCTMDVRALGPV